MMSACILIEKTFLPSERIASSSSRTPRRSRPQGLRPQEDHERADEHQAPGDEPDQVSTRLAC